VQYLKEFQRIPESKARIGIGSSKCGGKKKKIQTTILNKRLENYMSGTIEPILQPKPRNPSTLKQQVSVKMSQGDVKGAVRLLVSKESILPPSEDTIKKFKEKHPPKYPDEPNLPDFVDEDASFKTNSKDLLRAIQSFKKWSTGGPDGFLPQFLIDMSGKILGEPATNLVNTLVSFMNQIVFPGKFHLKSSRFSIVPTLPHCQKKMAA
jgi:hypothetical protein